MVKNTLISSVFVVLASLTAFNTCATVVDAKKELHARKQGEQWYRELRTNVNAASIIVGLYTGYYLCLNLLIEGGKYALNNTTKEVALNNAKDSFAAAACLGGLALTFEAFNKFYLRPAHYAKKAKTNEAIEALAKAQEESKASQSEKQRKYKKRR